MSASTLGARFEGIVEDVAVSAERLPTEERWVSRQAVFIVEHPDGTSSRVRVPARSLSQRLYGHAGAQPAAAVGADR